jgi:hypothetical protein
MTVCIQCAMRAMVAGQPAPTFDETPEAHAARVHPDPLTTQRERQQLEAQIAAMLPGANRTP